jgi:branched-chain amino acid transport system ATP-binding protein
MASELAPARSPLLTVQGLDAAYGRGAPAIEGVTLAVAPGEAVALIGANGAGKSTTIRAIAGLLRYHGGRIVSGEVTLGGSRIAGLRPDEIVKRGIANVPEGRMVFRQLTVIENLRLGAASVSKHDAADRIESMLEFFPVLAARRSQKAGWLSGGEQQMLAISRALVASPRVVLMDEVSLGLAPKITAQIFARLRDIIAESATAMLIVEQNARLALEFCESAYVIENGRIVLSGRSADLRDDPAVYERYVGVREVGVVDFVSARPSVRRRPWLR